MPIIQERLKSILDASQEYENALNFCQQTVFEVYSILAQQEPEDLSPREQQILKMLGALALAQRVSIQSTTILTREREHYRLTHHRNQRTAARQRRQRGNPRPEDSPFTASIIKSYGPHKHHASYTPTNPHAQPLGTGPEAEPLDFNPSDPHPDPVIPRPQAQESKDLKETEFYIEPDPQAMTPEDALELFRTPSPITKT